MIIQRLFGGFVVRLAVSLLLSTGPFIEGRSLTLGPVIDLMADGCAQ
jgi:hypothetical protein